MIKFSLADVGQQGRNEISEDSWSIVAQVGIVLDGSQSLMSQIFEDTDEIFEFSGVILLADIIDI